MGDYDVIVLGTGAAGLTAAVTAAEPGAKVGLFEKGATIGGTTVYSGGMIWIPLNQHEPPEKGDTREKALEYLKALSNDTITDEMAETYIDVGPEMVRWLDEHTPVKFRISCRNRGWCHRPGRGGQRPACASIARAMTAQGEW
jgi:3-oxosteroid 1-dehydrogenase